MKSLKKDGKNIVAIKVFEKKDNIISKLEESIDYGKDLKRQIEYDNVRRLSAIESSYESWCSDNSIFIEKVIHDHKIPPSPFGYVVTNIRGFEFLEYSPHKIAKTEYENNKRSLTAGVEYELGFLSSIRSAILEGNYCNEITWRVSESTKKISKSSNGITIICTIISIIIAIIIAWIMRKPN